MRGKVIIAVAFILVTVILIVAYKPDKSIETYESFNEDALINSSIETLTDNQKDYVKSIKSNIKITQDFWKFDYRTKDWFTYADSDDSKTLGALAYSVNEYYKGEVPCVFYYDPKSNYIRYTELIADFFLDSVDNSRTLKIAMNIETNNIHVSESIISESFEVPYE